MRTLYVSLRVPLFQLPIYTLYIQNIFQEKDIYFYYGEWEAFER